MTKEEQREAAEKHMRFIKENPQCLLRLSEQQQQEIDELRRSIINSGKQEDGNGFTENE